MEPITEQNTNATPASPKKKNYGSIFLIVFLVGVVAYFGGRYVINLGKAPAADTAVVVVKSSDTAAIVVPVVAHDSIAAVVDTTKK